jgi:hypothetical protein
MLFFIYLVKQTLIQIIAMTQTMTLLALCMFFTVNGIAQECTVVQESLKGTYVGECVKGKANGKGKAIGSDIYEGEFKNGLPEGKGKYIWRNQNYYVGSWKKGLRDGKGEMYYAIIEPGKDSVQVGYWKKDKYVGLYENPFEVGAMTSRITRVNCQISDKNGNDITFTISKIGNGITRIRDIIPLTGTYYNKNAQVMSNASVTRIKQVTFPFKAIFALDNGETVEILFNEKADYEVNILAM